MSEFYDFEYLNYYNGTRSPSGTVQNDWTTKYFMRCLYQRAISSIKFTMSLAWNKQYFENVLYRDGFIGIVRTSPKTGGDFGVIPQICTLSGLGLYLQPTDLLVAQPLVNFEGKIGKDCALIRLTPDYRGIWDIIEHYAIQMSTCHTSVMMSLKNSRLAFLLAAKNKAAGETLKEIAEQISSGETCIVYDKQLREGMDEQDTLFAEAFDPSKGYITDRLLDNMREILNAFDREIGIPSVDEKKERMITGEVNFMVRDSSARINTWIECLQESIDRAKQVFPDLELDFEIREEVEQYEPHTASDPHRNV